MRPIEPIHGLYFALAVAYGFVLLGIILLLLGAG